MSLLKTRLTETEKLLTDLKKARQTANKINRQQAKQSKKMRERKAVLIGEAVLARVNSGELGEAEFLKMMDDALSRPVDRALFSLK